MESVEILLKGFNAARIPKNQSNKSWALNFLQKSQETHMSISPRCGDRWLQRLVCLKYNVLKWESGITLGLNTAKNTDDIKKLGK